VRWRKEKCTTIFILVHSITELHPVYQNNMSLVSTIFKIFEPHKNLDTHPARITLTDLKSHQANQPEAQEHPNMMVVVPSQPYMCSLSYSQAKMPPRLTKINQDLQNMSCSCCIVERELSKDEWQSFLLKNSNALRYSRKHSLYSLV